MASTYKLAQASMAYNRFSFLFNPRYRFPVTELALDDPEYVFHLAAHRGFAVFDVAFPIDGVVTDFGKTAGAAVDAEVNLGKVFVVRDFGTILDTKIT